MRSVGRRDAEARLERVVRGNRFAIAVVFPTVGAVLLVASAEGFLPEPLAFNPHLVLAGTLAMRLPLIAALAPLLDRRAGVALLLLSAYAYGIELVGLATGLPYGEFRYLADLGPMVAGVPIGLPVFFLPLVVNAYLLSVLLLPAATRRRAVRIPVAVAVVLAVDLVLDPAAVAVGFWAYADGGAYYGVPASNYAGWALSGTVAVLALDLAFERADLLARLQNCAFALDDLVSFTLLWGAVNVYYANLLPALVTALLVAGLAYSGRFDFVTPRWRRGLVGRLRDL